MDNLRFPSRALGYDPALDLQEVDQFGFINVSEAIVNGIIPGDISIQEDSFNGVDDPSVLIPRAQDEFDAIRKAEYVRSSLSSLSAAEREKAENSVERVLDASNVSNG